MANKVIDMDPIPRVGPLALSCVAPKVFGKGRASVVAFVTVLIAALLTSCDPDPRDPQLENGWITNCAGPEFNRISPTGGAGAGRPVFRINDQLVLAVPRENHPNAARIDRAPRECRKISDLPPARYVQFLMQGDWSAGYRLQDIPTYQDGTKEFRPDRVWVRIEPEFVNPLSPEEQQKAAQMGWDTRHDVTEKKFEVAGLRCAVPKWKISPASYFCRARGTAADPDADPEVLTLRYFPEHAPPFVLIQADYDSPRYGKIHLYWQVWTSDISHALAIDSAIWNLISEWNLSAATARRNAAERGA